MANEYKVVGHSPIRADALSKVTGKAIYADDLYLDRMLYAAVRHSDYPHAKILSVNTSEAETLEGVAAVMTAKDIPGSMTFGGVIPNQYFLADNRVRYLGDGIAIVAAETEEIAHQAAALIKVEYEELAAIFDPDHALEPGAPAIHGNDNLIVHHKVRHGDISKGFEKADIVVQETFRTQMIEHAAMEPEASLAVPEPDGSITIHGSIQLPFSCRRAVAAALGLELNKVRIVRNTLGGSFGGKDEAASIVCARAALLSQKTGRPVKLVNTREESFIESYKRHPYRMRYKVGVKKDGKLTAWQTVIIADGGAYASMSPFVTWRSVVQASGPYEVPAVHTDVIAVYTNNTYTGAMRGFGSPQINFAIESMMDILAEKVGMDPLEFRLLNAFKNGSVTATGQKLDNHQVSVRETMRLATEAIGWNEKRGQKKRTGAGKLRGVGMASSYRGVSLGAEGVDACGAVVSVQEDGSVLVSCGITEIGQGAQTVLSQVAAETLGVSFSRVKFMETDTSQIPDGGPTVASRGTIMGGNAVKAAAEKVCAIMGQVIAKKLDVSEETIRFAENLVSSDGKSISFDEAVSACFAVGKHLYGFGWHQAPQVDWDEETGQGNAYFTYVYGTQCAEVNVDPETGKVEVLKVVAAHDVGKAVHPELLKGQICGGVAMGVGYALSEKVILEEGRTLNPNFNKYKITRTIDMPDVQVIPVEHRDPSGPYGAKCIAEPATEIAAPAIINAIYNATGVRITDLPATPAKIREALLLAKRNQ